jgi:hypothetical protein
MPLPEQQLLGEITRLNSKISKLEYALLYVQAYLFHDNATVVHKEPGKKHINIISVVDTALGGKFEELRMEVDQIDDTLN